MLYVYSHCSNGSCEKFSLLDSLRKMNLNTAKHVVVFRQRYVVICHVLPDSSLPPHSVNMLEPVMNKRMKGPYDAKLDFQDICHMEHQNTEEK